jgi:GNAT superfamily N-acetyltransferase
LGFDVRDRASQAVQLPDEPVGLFYAWWRGDLLPQLVAPDGLLLDDAPDIDLIQRISSLSGSEIEARIRQGNRAFAARIAAKPAGIGWSAAGEVGIGELGLRFDMPPGNRYLWDFVTLPEWRGRGIYPTLLQAFIRRETGAERFWVGHDLGNIASARGIVKAGFRTVGVVYDVPGSGPVFVIRDGDLVERAGPAAELLGIRLLED